MAYLLYKMKRTGTGKNRRKIYKPVSIGLVVLVYLVKGGTRQIRQ